MYPSGKIDGPHKFYKLRSHNAYAKPRNRRRCSSKNHALRLFSGLLLHSLLPSSSLVPHFTSTHFLHFLHSGSAIWCDCSGGGGDEVVPVSQCVLVSGAGVAGRSESGSALHAQSVPSHSSLPCSFSRVSFSSSAFSCLQVPAALLQERTINLRARCRKASLFDIFDQRERREERGTASQGRMRKRWHGMEENAGRASIARTLHPEVRSCSSSCPT